MSTVESTMEAKYLESADIVKKYRGKWVAVLDEKIIAFGDDVVKVYEEALKISKTRTPLFTRIPKDGEMDSFIL